MDRIELLVLVIRLDREERTYMDIYIFTTKIIFTGRLAETLKIQARNSIEAMQAYDYLPSSFKEQKFIFGRRTKKKKKEKRSRNFDTCETKIEEKREIKKKRERKIMLIVNKYLISFAATGQV